MERLDMNKRLGKKLYLLTIMLRIAAPQKRDAHRISEREIILLFALDLLGRSPVQLLAHVLDVPLNTSSSYIRRVSRRKFISRELDPDDARVHWLSLTSQGKSFVHKLINARGRGIDEHLDSLQPSEDELDTFASLLEKAVRSANDRVNQLPNAVAQLTKRNAKSKLHTGSSSNSILTNIRES
jgi:DNA-binding MarR family transcriptional regulator